MLARVSFFTLSLFTFSCSSVFYYPDKVLYYSPQKVGFKHQNVKFESKDGTKLFGWYFPASKKPKGTLVQFHGNAQNISSHYLTLVWLVDKGYNLFIFDYRGYGLSEGKPNPEGTYLDGLAGLEKGWDFHKKSGARRFIVIGQSLGGAIAMRSFIDFKHRKETDLIVLDSTFASYRTVARRVLASHWLTWILSPIGWLIVSNEYGSAEAIRENRTRMLVIHDKRDAAVPFACGEDIFEMANEPKDFWTPNQGVHIGIFHDPNSPYRKKFVDLLDNL